MNQTEFYEKWFHHNSWSVRMSMYFTVLRFYPQLWPVIESTLVLVTYGKTCRQAESCCVLTVKIEWYQADRSINKSQQTNHNQCRSTTIITACLTLETEIAHCWRPCDDTTYLWWYLLKKSLGISDFGDAIYHISHTNQTQRVEGLPFLGYINGVQWENKCILSTITID